MLFNLMFEIPDRLFKLNVLAAIALDGICRLMGASGRLLEMGTEIAALAVV